ncbi:MAG TPA: ATP-dependent DNA helicase, partial [Longimicrobiaceae bacterium]|nr:ATP-dependent DNA helicase [Longimicrobiaceae bacterium]
AGVVFGYLEDVLQERRDSMMRLEPEFERHSVWVLGLDEALTGLLVNLDNLLAGLETLRERITLDDEARDKLEPQLLELRGAGNRLSGAALALRSALRPPEDALRMVRWMERRGDHHGGEANIILAAAPLDLAGVLRETVLDNVPTVVMTSATLATRGDFSFLRGRLGIAPTDEIEEAIFPSPFDYDSQSLLAIPMDLPIPSSGSESRFDEATVRATEEMATITGGGIFVLFTSYRALRETAVGLRGRGADARWPLYVQGEAPRAQLIKHFTDSGRGILLGTTSFWEGVDVPGRPLRGLIIPRLPFKVPTEPVTAARIEAIDARGGNSFASFMLPHAAIRLKQGFGRLIRSRTDHGAVMILDGRIARKSYGRYLLDSLPPAPRVVAPWQAVKGELQRFYGLSGDGD